jgi:hypothetical protein
MIGVTRSTFSREGVESELAASHILRNIYPIGRQRKPIAEEGYHRRCELAGLSLLGTPIRRYHPG